jgi:hypothetical protein
MLFGTKFAKKATEFVTFMTKGPLRSLLSTFELKKGHKI